MEYNKLIAELHTGDDVEGFYVLKAAFLKTTAAGKPFFCRRVWSYGSRGGMIGFSRKLAWQFVSLPVSEKRILPDSLFM